MYPSKSICQCIRLFFSTYFLIAYSLLIFVDFSATDHPFWRCLTNQREQIRLKGSNMRFVAVITVGWISWFTRIMFDGPRLIYFVFAACIQIRKSIIPFKCDLYNDKIQAEWIKITTAQSFSLFPINFYFCTSLAPLPHLTHLF
jgi:hypothetical protein